MSEIKVLSVNISEKKGTIKKPVENILLDNEGVVGDAHAGDWHRQLSLLGKESIDKFILDLRFNNGGNGSCKDMAGPEAIRLTGLKLEIRNWK